MNKKTIIQSNQINLLLKNKTNWLRMGKLFFLRDNSICFTFPEISCSGLLSLSECSSKTASTQRVNLKKKGKVTKETVKFTYHTSGWVNFSKTNKIQPIKLKTEPLEGHNLHIFSCVFGTPQNFPIVSANKYRKYEKEGMIRYYYNAKSIYLSFYSYTKRNFDLNKYQKNNNILILSEDNKRVVEIKLNTTPLQSFEKNTCFIFIGGFCKTPKNTYFLSAMYPSGSYNMLKKTLGSVDNN